MYRNSRITKSAKGMPCANCGFENGTTVWAHSNKSCHGHGRGIKSHDIFGAYLCFNCHNWYDGRDASDLDPSMRFGLDEKQDMWRASHDKSLIYLLENGLLK